MKNLELQNYGVATLSAREMRDTNGGFPAVVVALMVLAYVGVKWAYDNYYEK